MARQPSVNAHWRDSARTVRFFIIESSAVYPMLFFFLYMNAVTFYFAVGVATFLSILARYGFTTTVFGRWLRGKIAGPRKMTNPWWE